LSLRSPWPFDGLRECEDHGGRGLVGEATLRSSRPIWASLAKSIGSEDLNRQDGQYHVSSSDCVLCGGLRIDRRELARARRRGPSKANAPAELASSPPSVLTLFGMGRIGPARSLRTSCGQNFSPACLPAFSLHHAKHRAYAICWLAVSSRASLGVCLADRLAEHRICASERSTRIAAAG
jgi:hypothetical protein